MSSQGQSAQIVSKFDAIVFPADERPPRVVQLMTTTLPGPILNPSPPYRCGQMPHPEVFMDYIAENLGHRAWKFVVVEALDYMHTPFNHPFIIFYPTVSRDGMPFPINECVREIQNEGRTYLEAKAWRGTIIVAKYKDTNFSAMADASMADFAILKNYLLQHYVP